MNILWTIFIGFFVGLIARLVMPGKDPAGFILTTLLGIAGSFLGSFIGQTMGWSLPGEPVDFFGSVMGALLVLVGLRAVRNKV